MASFDPSGTSVQANPLLSISIAVAMQHPFDNRRSHGLSLGCWCGSCELYWFDQGWICRRTFENQLWALAHGFQVKWIKATPTNPQDGGEIDILMVYVPSVFGSLYFDIYGTVRTDLRVYRFVPSDSETDSLSGSISGSDLEPDYHFIGTADPQYQNSLHL